MKAAIFALVLVFCYAECKKTYAPIDKNANIAFINMEGGGIKPAPRPFVPPTPNKAPSQPAPAPKPAPVQPATVKPVQPAPVTNKPIQTPVPKPVLPAQPKPVVAPAQPKTPTQIKPVPVNPAPVANPITTPGPGSVKDLVNFYNSQGKGSPIRPYSYSQAVKQG